MKTVTTDTRKDALEWWKGLKEYEKNHLCQQHFIGISPSTLMNKSIEFLYKAEHPQLPTTTVEEDKEVDIEKTAIIALRKGWGQLFMRADDGSPYGEFIGKRPYPTNFWHDVDVWIMGYKAAIEQANNSLTNKQG